MTCLHPSTRHQNYFSSVSSHRLTMGVTASRQFASEVVEYAEKGVGLEGVLENPKVKSKEVCFYKVADRSFVVGALLSTSTSRTSYEYSSNHVASEGGLSIKSTTSSEVRHWHFQAAPTTIRSMEISSTILRLQCLRGCCRRHSFSSLSRAATHSGSTG